jgi:hypothetical protein
MSKNTKRHSSEQIYLWSREYNLKDKYYKDMDPKFKEQQRMKALREGQTRPRKK